QILRDEGKLSVERTAHIAKQALQSLAEAHKKQVVHRDLKPDNIFLCNNEGQQDFVKVFDFGIAKIIGDGAGMIEDNTKLTVAGGTVGTPVYMSPEQCRGQELTAASDLYSLAVVLYECINGKVPFEDANPVQTMMMHNSTPVPPLPPEIQNEKLGQAIMKALNKKADDRFESAEAFSHFLGEPTSAHVAVETPAAPVPLVGRAAGRRSSIHAPQVNQGMPMWMIITATVMFALVVALATLLVMQNMALFTGTKP
ncbi:MAG: serine/threonine protein kinase, partial [Planctomycetales bacterium]